MKRAKQEVVGEEGLLSAIALAIGEPARMRMLLSLMDGHARTSTELAALAGVSASTASAHLHRLREMRLVRVAAEGRHRYYALRGKEVARVLEGLSVLAGGTKKFVPSTPEPMRKARRCYDHMAGTVAVAVHDHFLAKGWLAGEAGGAYEVSGQGAKLLGRLGIDLVEMKQQRRRFAYGCLDWSERRPHIAGALGAALLDHALARKWVVRELNSRTLSVTKFGEREMLQTLGLRI